MPDAQTNHVGSPLPACPSTAWSPPRVPRRLLDPPSLSLKLIPSFGSLSHAHRARPSPPSPSTVATETPSSNHRIPELRRPALPLLVDARNSRSSRTPPPSPSSPFKSGDPRGRIRHRRGLPEPNETANDPAVSSTPFPLLRFARPCSVASSPMSPCVRRRARSSPASFPATPRPPVRSFGCGRARGAPWCQQRDELPSLTRVRRALAVGLVIAGVDLVMMMWPLN